MLLEKAHLQLRFFNEKKAMIHSTLPRSHNPASRYLHLGKDDCSE